VLTSVGEINFHSFSYIAREIVTAF